jgi:hypothetical protein
MIVQSSKKHVKPEKFLANAWKLDLVIASADVAKLDIDFVSELIALSEEEGIVVHRIDFSKYHDATEAMNAEENASFSAAVSNEAEHETLLLFDNCDTLASLDENLTFTLREILTTRFSGMTQSVFIARNESIELLFCNSDAAFYQSNYPITGIPNLVKQNSDASPT